MLSSKLLLFCHFSLVYNFLTVERERKLVIIFVFDFSALENTKFTTLTLLIPCMGIK